MKVLSAGTFVWEARNFRSATVKFRREHKQDEWDLSMSIENDVIETLMKRWQIALMFTASVILAVLGSSVVYWSIWHT